MRLQIKRVPAHPQSVGCALDFGRVQPGRHVKACSREAHIRKFVYLPYRALQGAECCTHLPDHHTDDDQASSEEFP
jgi:hypothetical protein